MARPGTKLAGFTVLAEIGQGAASRIYLAQDPKTKQVWALKHVEKHNPKDQRFLDQAMNEYEVASRVESDFVRQISRVIKARAGLLQIKELFLVMEYVDGAPLEYHLPATFEEALSVFVQTARGLAAIHKAGFVHADMKPSNIVVSEQRRVKVIDLGQACPVGTVKERIQGTPDYIAPEQVHRREITEQTDVYNFGATMYWTLTQRNIPTALGDAESLVQSLDDTFIEPPTPVHELNPRCPGALSELISHCVQVRVEERPPGAMLEVHERLKGIRAEMTNRSPSSAGIAAPSRSEADA
ncbi:MAG: serine/threonine-protein kinase [Planctomycetota bacterium]